MIACEIGTILSSPEEIKEANRLKMKSLGLEYGEFSNHAYLPRAVSSLPEDVRQKINLEYERFVAIVKDAGLVPRLPVELGKVENDRINELNHKSLHESKLILPFAYMMPDGRGASDGRGWEMGYAYGSKLLVPVTYRGQKINTPSLRLHFQLPIIINSLESDGIMLRHFLEDIVQYELATGRCTRHGDALLGQKGKKMHCLKGVAENYFELVPTNGF